MPPALGPNWSDGVAKRGQDGAPGGPEDPADGEPLPLADLTAGEKYPLPVRLALIVGLPLALWALIGAGAVWLLSSLWGRVVGVVVLGAFAVVAILFASSQGRGRGR